MQITEQKNIILIKECKDVKTVSVTKETNENVNCMNTTLVLRSFEYKFKKINMCIVRSKIVFI